MSDAPDIRDLARRYLDLWQDQIDALAADPRLAESFARSMAFMAQAMPAAGWAGERKTAERGTDQTGGAAPAAAAAEPGGGQHDGLARRVAELEKRVADLERQLDGANQKAVRRTRGKPG